MSEIRRVFAPNARRPWLGVSLAASGGLHALSLAALAWAWPAWSDLDPPARLVGRAQVLQLKVEWAAPASPEVDIGSVGDPPVVVQPQSARIEKRQYVIASTHVELPDVESAPVAVPFARTDVELASRPEVEPAVREPDAGLPRQILRLERSSTTSNAPATQTPGVTDTTPPSFIHNRPPRYPELARSKGWQGTVLLRLQIDATGQVIAVEVARSSGYALLDAEAVNTVRQWRALPARRFGQPVKTEEFLPIRFSLDDADQ